MTTDSRGHDNSYKLNKTLAALMVMLQAKIISAKALGICAACKKRVAHHDTEQLADCIKVITQALRRSH